MIPLRDNIPSRTTPYVTYGIILFCLWAFAHQLVRSNANPSLIERFGMIPARVLNPDAEITVVHRVRVETPMGPLLQEQRVPVAKSTVPAWLTPVTCIFLHGGWLHLIGNMWILFIFGDNVEDRLGHGKYLFFYVASGALASLAHLAIGPGSTVPTIGASGAIAGVMGAYMVLYPQAKVQTIVPVIFIWGIWVLPAPVFLGIWFVMQFFSGAMSITSMESAGVAWWAHIGGFVVGFVVALGLRGTRYMRPAVETVRPRTERVQVYRVHPTQHYRRGRRLN